MPSKERAAGARLLPETRWARIRLALLCGCLIGLAAFLLVADVFEGSKSAPRLAGLACRYRGPEVRQVAASALGTLRESVIRVLPAHVGRLYEEGTVQARDAWDDGNPKGPPVDSSALRPAAYEMRWWAPDGDDVVADVFSFAHRQQAQDFMQMAGSGHCRSGAKVAGAPRPPLARDVEWVNPDAYGQADVYLRRGELVYRVADVPGDQRIGGATTEQLQRALVTIDTLACLLPKAHCLQTTQESVPS